MSSKEIRSALKAAKTAIQSKDYATALLHCENILSKDPENYNALVFAGLCCSETSRAEDARDRYRIAIKCQPEQILGYQGLANLYLKHWKKLRTKDETLELVGVCKKVLSSIDRKDTKKKVEALMNLCDAFLEADEPLMALENIAHELKSLPGATNEAKIPLYDMTFKILQTQKNWNKVQKYNDIIEESFQHVVSSENEELVLSKLGIYLSYVQRNPDGISDKIPFILDVCHDLTQKFANAKFPLEVIAQALIQNYKHSSLNDVDALLTKLKESKSKYADICEGYLALEAEDFEKSFKRLTVSLPEVANFLPGWIVLCQTSLQLHKYSEARSNSKKALGEYRSILNGSQPTWLLLVMSLEEAKFELTKCLVISLCHSREPEDISKGILTFQKLLSLKPADVALHVSCGQGFITLGKYAEASDSFKRALDLKPDDQEPKTWLIYLETKHTGKLEDGIEQLEALAPTPLSTYLLGKTMWEAGGHYRKDKKNCFAALVKAAKLNPNRSDVFFLLGHFYAKVQRDSARARGCYQKAYTLDPQHQEAASCLADTYIEQGETSLAIALYENITKDFGSAGGKWAWLRLGLCKLKAKDMSDAIQCFQVALRLDGEDSICWECLGEGYLQRGSYTAAWKAFDRAHQLNSQSVYSLYQMARVKQVQGFYPEAIKEYNEVLMISQGYVPALQGLGESELYLARQMFRGGRYQAGIEHIENAIEKLVIACTFRKDLCCLWKLLGDSCILVHSLDNSAVSVSIPSVLVGGDVNDKSQAGKSKVLSLAVRFYGRAISLSPDNATSWHDLGVAYFRQAEDKQNNETADSADRAMQAIKKAITLDKSNHVFWCSLGVIAASEFVKDASLAQHCFLMSIKCEENNVQAWNNLATLYLAHDYVKKAHEAFKIAQSLEPSFTNSWVGQAVIADAIASEETMDLYRHSTELGLQTQGTAGYCSWVAKVMTDQSNRDSRIFDENVRNMNALTTATTQMSKACLKNPKCPWSSTMHGILLEYSGLNLSAEDAYQNAYDILQGNSTKENEIMIRRNMANSNLARLLWYGN